MKELAITLRCLQLYAHNAHNLVARIVFMQDHEMLGEIYTAAEGDYDSVIERIIGLYGSEQVNLVEIQHMACQKMATLPSVVKENSMYFQAILQLESDICTKVNELVRGQKVTVGTEQMIGDIADRSEVRQYKLKQRIKK
jgi:DNA-binding ferritin-like protein